MTRMAERIAGWWALAGGALVLAIMAVTSVNAAGFALDRLARLAGSSIAGLTGYEDFVRLTVSCAALMFLPYCQLRKGHIAVDLVADLMSRRARRLCDRAWLAATAGLALFLAWWMVLGMLETRADHGLAPVLGWPEWPFYAPGAVSLVLWALIAALQAFETAGPDTDDA